MLNLDTHIVLAIAEGSLRKDEERLVQADFHWAASAVVLWEIAKLHQSGRIKFGLDHPELSEVLDRIEILPLTLDIARESQRLDFEADPADEIIAATSIVHEAPLVTRDTRITGSKIVPLALK